MPTLRQMPGIYLRGSLANITMAQLTEEEKRNINDITIKMANHPIMQRHKSQIIKQWGITIGGDYSSDPHTAESDYQIAIWRGVVSLLYHREYQFKCSICNSNSYTTKRGSVKTIDRQSKHCPNCNKTLLNNKPIDYFAYKDMLDAHDLPESQSPIIAIKGEKKYSDPEKVLNDPKQLKKFFGEFAWNYFRQHLKENKRKEHKTKPQLVSGAAKKVISDELRSACYANGIDCYTSELHNGYSHKISHTPPEFSIDLIKLRQKAELNEVMFNIIGNTIIITSERDIEIEAYISRPEQVQFIDNTQCISEDESTVSVVDQIDYKSIEGHKTMTEDHVSLIEIKDAIEEVRETLPAGTCREVYDILCQQGTAYDNFVDRFGNGDPRINHIAEYLEITTRAVNSYKEKIKLVCLSHGLSP